MEINKHEFYGGIEVVSEPSINGGYLAWGKRGEIAPNDIMNEPGDVYFKFHRTERQAVDAVLAEIQAS